ncbi:hypothetical protein SCHPADRAFT_919848 [Schizopora paradoxa]|uniref:Uncharacterized protein n=1 Tax=Schizopora paradoxa TaxID=27342 RepID=A0A0H2RY91_9AGAM|nr:hypothetical protein SCHPADRAFT_919848 [Schizopora paradoxa]
MSDTESDPDFVNKATFEYEKKGKRNRKEVRAKVGTRGKRRRVVLSEGTGNKPAVASGNLLYKYFAEVLPSSVEEEEEESEEADFGDDSDNDSNVERGSDDDYFSTVRRVPSSQNNRQVTPPRQIQSQAEESVTESESEEEHVTYRPPAILYPAQVHDDSVTESESDDEVVSSVTEDETEDELDDLQGKDAKPMLIRDASQPMLGPLVLNANLNIQVPALVNTFLREYQRDGIRFFWERFEDKRGGVLGDDMGLGKTIQVISFLSAIMKKFGDKRDSDRRSKRVSELQDGNSWKKNRKLPPANAEWPTCLIIAPSTVVHNWKRELETWGYFEVGLYTGLPEERGPVLNDFKLGRLDILVTSFDTARNDMALLDNLALSVIFVDEAHKLKNPRSKITVAFSQFNGDAVRFGLTGTAIQNSYRELWTVLNWASPGRLGTEKQWNEIVGKPLIAGQSASASDDERAKGRAVAKILVEKLLPLFFLRRTKDLIKHQLPEKIDEVVFCPLTPMQILVYKRVLALKDVAELRRSFEKCDCGSQKRRTKCCHPMESSHFFTYLAILLKVSNHLALVLPAQTDNEEQRRRNREIAQQCFGVDRLPAYGQAILLPEFCGKWEVLNKLLIEWRADPTNKVLIFTKSVKLLDMLDYHLSKNGFPFVTLDGSTKQSERMPRIDQFNNEPDMFIFLISTLAGGTGLNLTSANKVVIFDPNWNPAHDLQAMDRAYRFGQRRNVHVYRLLGAGSIEELIYARQVYKQQMMKIGYEASNQTRYFHGVQDDKSRRGELFGLENIFKLHEDTLATKMAIERAHLAEFDWALLHMDAKASKRKAAGSLAAELEGKEGKEKTDDNDTRGLATLFFDDSSQPTGKEQEDGDIQQILNGSIKYSHRNDSLLRPSRIEEESLRVALKRRRSSGKNPQNSPRTKKGKRETTPDMNWPPRRGHHLAPQSPKSKLRLKQKALIETEIIKDIHELPQFATRFGEMSPEEQEDILRRLKEYEKTGKK